MEQELKKKISDAYLEPFVGNYVFSQEELTKIYEKVGLKLRFLAYERGSSLSVSDYELVFVALVNLAKEWNSEEDAFFDYIYKKLLGSISNNGKAYTQIVNVVNVLSRNKIFILNSFTKKYYATICSHAFAPQLSIESFFDMCWEIYCKDLDQQYEENDSTFNLIASSLNNRFAGNCDDNEDFQIGSHVYSFRAGIKGLAIDQVSLLSRLINCVMKAINSLFNSIPLNLNKYINILVNNWWMKKESLFGIKRINNLLYREHVVNDYSQIKPKYIIENGFPQIFIPSIRLKNNFDYEPIIEIIINGKIKIKESMPLKGSGILMSTTSMKYRLSELGLLDDIVITITHRGKIIYDSKDALKRNFILFKDEKEIVSDECIPGLYAIYTANLQSLYKYPKDIHKSVDNVYSFDAVVGDIIQDTNKTVFFLNEKNERDLYFFAKENNRLTYFLNNEEFKVIEGELYLDVEDEIDVKDLGIRYTDTSFKLTDFSFEKIMNKKRFLLSSLANNIEPQKISVFKYSTNEIVCSIAFIKFLDISLEFDKRIYYDTNLCGTVKFKANNVSIEKEFDAKDEEIFIKIGDGEIIIKPPVFKWKIDNGEWNYSSANKGLWYKDITNTSLLYIDLPENEWCEVCVNNEFIERTSNKQGYKLGQSIYSLSQNNDFMPLVLFAKLQDILLPIIDIYTKEQFLEDPIYIFNCNHEIIWLPELFVGDQNSKFRIDIYSNSLLCKSVFCDTNKQKLKLETLIDGFYSLKINLIKQGFLKQESLLYEKEFILGNEKELKFLNKKLYINSAMLFDNVNPCPIRPIYLDNLKYLGSRDGFDYYSGNLYVITKNGDKAYLDTMKNENNHYVKINPIRIELKSNNSCYLGYGLNCQDENFEYDDEFTLDSYGKTNIVLKLDGKKTRGIDYFLFEVKNV